MNPNPTFLNPKSLGPKTATALTDGYHVMTMRTMNRMVESEKKGPRKPAICLAVSGSSGSLAAVSNSACAAATARWPASGGEGRFSV